MMSRSPRKERSSRGIAQWRALQLAESRKVAGSLYSPHNSSDELIPWQKQERQIILSSPPFGRVRVWANSSNEWSTSGVADNRKTWKAPCCAAEHPGLCAACSSRARCSQSHWEGIKG